VGWGGEVSGGDRIGVVQGKRRWGRVEEKSVGVCAASWGEGCAWGELRLAMGCGLGQSSIVVAWGGGSGLGVILRKRGETS